MSQKSKTAHGTLRGLCNIYHPKCNASVLQHLQTFFSLSQGTDSVQICIIKVKNATRQVRDIASKEMIVLTDALIAAKLLISASPHYKRLLAPSMSKRQQ
jgi:hypothetical protein